MTFRLRLRLRALRTAVVEAHARQNFHQGFEALARLVAATGASQDEQSTAQLTSSVSKSSEKLDSLSS